MAVKRLVSQGIEVEAIGQRVGELYGVTIQKDFPKLTNIDTITLYINPSRQPEYYDYIIELHPRRVIFNPGTENSEFYSLLRCNIIDIEEACTLVLLATDSY